MATEKLDALIIRNLSDLDAAATRLYWDIQEKVGKELDGLAEAWTKKHSWDGKFNFHVERLWVAPPEWTASTEAEALGRFALEAGSGDDWDSDDRSSCLDFFWLTRLCGAGRSSIGIRWYYGAEALGAKKSSWRKFVQPYIQPVERKTGFSYEDTAPN